MIQEIQTEASFAALVDILLKNPGVTFGSSDKKSFGSSALKVHGKTFAMINSEGEFVVKLPRQHVDALVAAGEAERFDPGHGRLMKEWVALDPNSEAEWLPLARDAMEFVASKT